MDKIEKLKIAEYLHNLRVSYGGKTLRRWCKEHEFNPVLWSQLENGLWHKYTTEEILEELPPAFHYGELGQQEEITVSIRDGEGKLLFEYTEPIEVSKRAMQNIVWIKKGVWTIKKLLNIDLDQLLSERTFTKEELKCIKSWREDKTYGGTELNDDTEGKINKLLKEEE